MRGGFRITASLESRHARYSSCLVVKLISGVAILLVFGSQQPALAQEDSATPVDLKFGDHFHVDGIPFGGGTIFPKISLGTKLDEDGELGFIIGPALAFHAAPKNISVDAKFDTSLELLPLEQDLGDVSSETAIELVKRVSAKTQVKATGNYLFEHTSDSDDEGVSPTIENDHTITGSFELGHFFDVGILTLGLDGLALLHQDSKAENGEKRDRSAQDYVEPQFSARWSFLNDIAVYPFFEVAYVNRRYMSDRDRQGRRRHMQGPEFIAGVELEGDRLSGQIAAIYLTRNYREPGLGETSAFGPYIDLTWRPNAVTEIVVAAAVSIDQESLGKVQGIPVYGFHAEFNHELRDDLSFGAIVDATYEDDKGLPDIFTITPELSLAWQLQSNIAWTTKLSASWEKQRHQTGDFSGVVTMGFEIRL
jgi:hypothetical protein